MAPKCRYFAELRTLSEHHRFEIISDRYAFQRVPFQVQTNPEYLNIFSVFIYFSLKVEHVTIITNMCY